MKIMISNVCSNNHDTNFEKFFKCKYDTIFLSAKIIALLASPKTVFRVIVIEKFYLRTDKGVDREGFEPSTFAGKFPYAV